MLAPNYLKSRMELISQKKKNSIYHTNWFEVFFLKKSSLPKVEMRIWLSTCFMTMKFCKISKSPSNLEFSFNGHVGTNQENYKDQHGGCDYGIRIKEGGRILEFCTAKNMIVGNLFLKKRVSRLWVCFIKNSGRLLFGEENSKKVFESCKSPNWWRAYHPA